MNSLKRITMNPLKRMYHESRDVSLIKRYIITLHMYYDSTINRLWSLSHIHGFSFFHPITKEKRLLRNRRTCAYETWKIIAEHLSSGYKL